MNKSVNQ